MYIPIYLFDQIKKASSRNDSLIQKVISKKVRSKSTFSG